MPETFPAGSERGGKRRSPRRDSPGTVSGFGLRLLALAFLALEPHVGQAQAPQLLFGDAGEIRIDAEEITYDKRTDIVTARGQVVIQRGETELHAEEVEVNRTTNEAQARGHVIVRDPNGTIAADAVRLNLDEETGWLETAEIQSPRYHYSLWGERVEKGLGQSYHIENGRFTTCRCGTGAPSWSIAGQDLEVSLGGYGHLRGGTFNVLDVPVIYIPRMIFPVQRDRQSGLLTPRFGASNTRGFQTLLPFYWAIDKSQDATLAVDVETAARVGTIGEYRYVSSREGSGNLNATYFNESIRGATPTTPAGNPIPQNRWSLLTDNEQKLWAGSHAYADVFVVSDDMFLREINAFAFDQPRVVAIRTLPFTESHVGMVHLWNRVGLKGEGTYYQNLVETSPTTESETLQRLPEVSLWAQHRVGQYFLGELNAGVVDFQRSRGADGLRFNMVPSVTVPLPLGKRLVGSVQGSVSETAYHLSDTEIEPSSNTAPLPRNASRELFQVAAGFGSTLERIYPIGWLGLEKLKHTIEPNVQYLYIPPVGQGDLPLFDGTDRVNHRNLFTYGVVSRFVGKFSRDAAATADGAAVPALPTDDSIRELGRFSLMQSVDASRNIGPITQTGSATAGVGDHFSDIDLDARVNPSRSLSVRVHTNYDTRINDISAARVGLFVEDPRYADGNGDPRLETRTSAGISYRFLTQSLLQELDDNIVVRLNEWAGFVYSSRYDVIANRFLDNFYGLRFLSTCDCWALDVTFADRTNPHEVEVRAQLTLAGLGSSKSLRRVAAMP